ncbi:MAG: NlpC/P60 family protein [Bacteroidales bacterium]
MQRKTIFFLFILIFFSTSCSLFRAPTKPEAKTEKAVSSAYADYSEKFGYTLTGKEDLDLLKVVDRWLGVPYRYGGCSQSGTDCSCLIGNIYREVYGVELPRRSVDISKQAKKISRDDLQQGDLIFFKISRHKISHVGLHISRGYFIHASTSSGVVINHWSEPYYKERIAFSGRIKK